MNNLIFHLGNKTYKRIDKRQAKKAYLNGRTVLLVPCNLKPNFYSFDINKKRDADLIADEIGANNRFRELVNSFEFYNCKNTETGLYTAFYIEYKYPHL